MMRSDKITPVFMLVTVVLFIMMTSLSIYAFEQIKKAFLNSSIFVLKSISVTGNSRVYSADIIGASGLRAGIDKISLLVPHILERKVKAQSVYIEQAKLNRRLSDGSITIAIKERKPAGLIAVPGVSGLFIVVDSYGLILGKVDNKSVLSTFGNIPMIITKDMEVRKYEIPNTRYNTRGTEIWFYVSYIASPSVLLALKVLRNAHTQKCFLLNDISLIDARDPDDIRLNTKQMITIRLASDRIKEGLTDVEYWIKEYQKPEAGYLDARFPNAIYSGGNSGL